MNPARDRSAAGGSATQKPLALSLGDPAGVGPEIVVKAWSALRETGPTFLVVGDHDALAAAAPSLGAAAVQRIGAPEEAQAVFRHRLPVLDIPLQCRVVAGKASSEYAREVVRWIETGAGLALSGAVAGLVTAPIAKAPLYDAGFGFPGHTEFLAELTARAPHAGPRGPVMMLAAADLRTVLVTIHTPLSTVPGLVTRERIIDVARVADHALRTDFGVAAPRLALAGLNPHAGEGGAIGREEVEIIGPAAAELRRMGIDCTDPKPADTLFHPEARATYDVAVCLYHDQALIPVKSLDFWGGVNITLGLPIVRTSPDHGVGYDIAGRGLGRPDSLIAAIHAAADIARRRRARR